MTLVFAHWLVFLTLQVAPVRSTCGLLPSSRSFFISHGRKMSQRPGASLRRLRTNGSYPQWHRLFSREKSFCLVLFLVFSRSDDFPCWRCHLIFLVFIAKRGRMNPPINIDTSLHLLGCSRETNWRKLEEDYQSFWALCIKKKQPRGSYSIFF